jgi:hypothetical protein
MEPEPEPEQPETGGVVGRAGSPQGRSGAPDAPDPLEEPLDPLEEPLEPVSGPPAPRLIRRSDRVVALGKTGSGKSWTLGALFADYAGQRLLVDVNDAYELGPACEPDGVCIAHRVREIDWRARSIRFVPSGREADYEDLYAAVWQRGRMLVWLDEAYGPTTASRCPHWLRRVVTQGRKRDILHAAATQRPAHVLPDLITQAEHALVFELPPYEPDLRAVAIRLGMTSDELAGELRRLPRVPGHGTATGYLRHDLGHDQILRMPPLPPATIARVSRTVVMP